MKKLLVGLLALGSISSFANENLKLCQDTYENNVRGELKLKQDLIISNAYIHTINFYPLLLKPDALKLKSITSGEEIFIACNYENENFVLIGSNKVMFSDLTTCAESLSIIRKNIKSSINLKLSDLASIEVQDNNDCEVRN
jgi:hypothetical protein